MKFFTILIALILVLNSCEVYKPTDARNFPIIKKEKKNLEEGKGLRLSGLGVQKNEFSIR